MSNNRQFRKPVPKTTWTVNHEMPVGIEHGKKPFEIGSVFELQATLNGSYSEWKCFWSTTRPHGAVTSASPLRIGFTDMDSNCVHVKFDTLRKPFDFIPSQPSCVFEVLGPSCMFKPTFSNRENLLLPQSSRNRTRSQTIVKTFRKRVASDTL